jgi:hypothetical protein
MQGTLGVCDGALRIDLPLNCPVHAVWIFMVASTGHDPTKGDGRSQLPLQVCYDSSAL